MKSRRRSLLKIEAFGWKGLHEPSLGCPCCHLPHCSLVLGREPPLWCGLAIVCVAGSFFSSRVSLDSAQARASPPSRTPASVSDNCGLSNPENRHSVLTKYTYQPIRRMRCFTHRNVLFIMIRCSLSSYAIDCYRTFDGPGTAFSRQPLHCPLSFMSLPCHCLEKKVDSPMSSAM